MKALFDLTFTKFVSPSIARIVYLLILGVIGLFYLIAVIVAFMDSFVSGLLVMIIVGPLVALLYLVLARVGLESLIATIRTAENTAELVRLNGGGQSFPPSAGPSSYGNGPQYPPVPSAPQV